MSDLKACPFCGGKDPKRVKIVHWNGSTMVQAEYRAGCLDCDVSQEGDDADTPEAAAAAWNTRASPWQPIDTAPKDGTEIILAMFARGRLIWAENDQWVRSEGCWSNMPSTVAIIATHWMPVPDLNSDG